MQKECFKCKCSKDESFFYLDSKNPNKRRRECKKCISDKRKESTNEEIIDKRRSIARKSAKKCRQENYQEYRKKENDYRKKRYSEDLLYKNSAIQKSTNYKKNKRKNKQYRILDNARARPSNFLKSKNNKHSISLGCTRNELVIHLESLFQPGMAWDNYGNSEGQWNIDHKYPLSIAYKEGIESFAKACHFSNLQPMWAIDNTRKSNKTGNL